MKKVIDKFKTYNPSNKEMLLYLLLPIILSFFACKVISNDFWFIINIGRYITNHGFFYIDPFTIHEGLHVVVQQWPVDLIFYHIYNFFGINGIYILILILFFIIMTLIYVISKMISNNTKLSIFITTLVSLLLLLFRFVETRPQLFDYIFLLLEIYILEKYIRSNNKKILFLLPLISILFINFHASTWIMLILFMVPYLIDSFRFKLGIFRGEGYKKRYLFLVFILVIIGGFVNPYGVDAITYAFNGTSNVINNYVKEMKPIYDWGLFPMLIVIISIIFSISSYIKKGTIRIRYLCLQLGTLFLSILHYRCLSLFFITNIFLADTIKFSDDRDSISKCYILKQVFICFIIGVIVGITVDYDYIEYKDINNIAEYMKENVSIDSIIYTEHSGPYLEYIGYKVYFDSRMELFLKKMNKKEDILSEFDKVQRNIDVDKFLEKYNFDYLIVENSGALNYYLSKSDNYKIVIKQKIKNNKIIDEKREYLLYEKVGDIYEKNNK